MRSILGPYKISDAVEQYQSEPLVFNNARSRLASEMPYDIGQQSGRGNQDDDKHPSGTYISMNIALITSGNLRIPRIQLPREDAGHRGTLHSKTKQSSGFPFGFQITTNTFT